MNPTVSIDHLRGLEPHLRAKIRGQDHVLPRLAAALARGALNLTAPDRPRGSFLFVGPTGTGKTETFTTAIEYLYGKDRLLSFDMSEYQDESAVRKLIGEHRGDPGLLGHALQRISSGGILFDEFEKAHPRLMDLFLQILWHGRITLTTGETLSLSPFFLCFTGNIGGFEAAQMEDSSFAAIEQATLRRVTQTLRPELVGRICEKFVFSKLTPAIQREILLLEVSRETMRLAQAGFDLKVTAQVLECLLRDGFDRQLGARPLRQTVERHLQDAVVSSLFRHGAASSHLAVDSGIQRVIIRSPAQS